MAWLIGYRATVKGQLERAEALLATLPQRIDHTGSSMAIERDRPRRRICR